MYSPRKLKENFRFSHFSIVCRRRQTDLLLCTNKLLHPVSSSSKYGRLAFNYALFLWLLYAGWCFTTQYKVGGLYWSLIGSICSAMFFFPPLLLKHMIPKRLLLLWWNNPFRPVYFHRRWIWNQFVQNLNARRVKVTCLICLIGLLFPHVISENGY